MDLFAAVAEYEVAHDVSRFARHFPGAHKAACSHSEWLPATAGEGHKKSSEVFQKICREEPEEPEK